MEGQLASLGKYVVGKIHGKVLQARELGSDIGSEGRYPFILLSPDFVEPLPLAYLVTFDDSSQLLHGDIRASRKGWPTGSSPHLVTAAPKSGKLVYPREAPVPAGSLPWRS